MQVASCMTEVSFAGPPAAEPRRPRRLELLLLLLHVARLQLYDFVVRTRRHIQAYDFLAPPVFQERPIQTFLRPLASLCNLVRRATSEAQEQALTKLLIRAFAPSLSQTRYVRKVCAISSEQRVWTARCRALGRRWQTMRQ